MVGVNKLSCYELRVCGSARHLYFLSVIYMLAGMSHGTNDGLTITTEKNVHIVNSTIKINCSLHHSNRTTNASDIRWTVNGVNGEASSILDSTTSQLIIERVQFEDSAIYGCKLNRDFQQKEVKIEVGLKPQKVTAIKCYSYDVVTFNCTWTNGPPTNIETVHQLLFREGRGGDYRVCNVTEGCKIAAVHKPIFYKVNSSNMLNTDGVLSDTSKFLIEDIFILTPPRLATVTAVSNSTLQVSWHHSKEYERYPDFEKEKLEYTVEWALKNTEDWIDYKLSMGLDKSRPNYTIRNLKANSVYSISIQGIIKLSDSTAIMLQGRTSEIAPVTGVSLNLLCKRIADTRDAILMWTPFPEEKSNGQILNYVITISDKKNTTIVTKESNAVKHQIKDTDLYQDYNITIKARNSAGDSDVDECSVRAQTRESHTSIIMVMIILVCTVIFIAVFVAIYKFWCYYKSSRIPEIKLPHHIHNVNFYTFGVTQRLPPREQEKYDELLNREGLTAEPCNGDIPNGIGEEDQSIKPIMPPEHRTTEESVT